MKTLRLFVGLVAMCALCGVLSSSATAQVGPWGVWAPWYSYPFGSYATSYGTIPTPPYFAIHPPVYYGPRIRMAYGHSPIARPPLTVVGLGTLEETPEAPLQSGVTIWNQYVADASGASSKSPAAVKPQFVANPHCPPQVAEASTEPRIAARPVVPAAQGD
jgi:hypothetical protein